MEYQYPYVYKVVKGQDEKGFKFFIRTDINEECVLHLKEGDVLLLELEDEEKVWFTCTTLLLIGEEFINPRHRLRMTKYGTCPP